MGFFSEAWARLNASTPTFFKKIAKTGAGLVAAGTAIVTPSAIPGVPIHIPDVITKIATYGITSGLVMMGVSKLVVENMDDIKK